MGDYLGVASLQVTWGPLFKYEGRCKIDRSGDAFPISAIACLLSLMVQVGGITACAISAMRPNSTDYAVQ